jgi:thymidylate synthase (FAD)
MNVRLIAKTVICDQELLKELSGDNSPEALMLYCARVSNPESQTSNNPGLLRYCMKHQHWSVFQQSDFTFEIVTSRAISAQILRHKSFHFQEWSQRYQVTSEIEYYPARRQDLKNRQNSIDDMSQEDKDFFQLAQESIAIKAQDLYKECLQRGIAKEQARMLLPLNTRTKLYMKGTVRDWIHYVNVRTDPSTQKEHRDIAIAIKEILIKEIPIIAEAAGWNNN